MNFCKNRFCSLYDKPQVDVVHEFSERWLIKKTSVYINKSQLNHVQQKWRTYKIDGFFSRRSHFNNKEKAPPLKNSLKQLCYNNDFDRANLNVIISILSNKNA